MERYNSLDKDAEEISAYLSIFGHLYSDIVDGFSASHTLASVSAYSEAEGERDIQEIEHRTRHEGLSFLTKILPRFGKAIDLALATSTQLQVSSFERMKGSQLPKLFRQLTSLVFDDSGWERSDASPGALSALRQLLYFFYKVEFPLCEKQSNEVIEQFKVVDRELALVNSSGAYDTVWINRQAKNLIHRILAAVSPRGSSLLTRHGPGSVATGEKSFEKPVFRRFYRSLNVEFPYEEYFYYNLSHFTDELDHYLNLEELESGTAKVVLVPKDSRGPRLISCEPLEYQWIQQGLMAVLTDAIEKSPLTGGQVNFVDQTINADLAMRGSRGEPWVTLDMQEASDRVSLALVKDLFPSNWYAALAASRSTHTKLPCGEIIPLNKFAPMGSALCFPVESLVFWALSVASIHMHRPNIPLERVMRSVFVYGDDLIVPIQDHEFVLQYLPRFGLKFNAGKCCTRGSFRESCGCDAYKGVDVTPLRMKQRLRSSYSDTEFVSMVALHNAAIERNCFNLADHIRHLCRRCKRIPYGNKDSAYLCWVDPRKITNQANASFRTRFSRALHRREIHTWYVRGRIIINTSTPGWSEMQRIASLGRQQSDSDTARASITTRATAYHYALPRQATLRRGWMNYSFE